MHSGLGGSLHSQVLLSASCDISAREGHFFPVCSQAKPHTPKRQSRQNFQSSFDGVFSPWPVWGPLSLDFTLLEPPIRLEDVKLLTRTSNQLQQYVIVPGLM